MVPRARSRMKGFLTKVLPIAQEHDWLPGSTVQVASEHESVAREHNLALADITT